MYTMEYEAAETDGFRSWRENLRDVQARHRIQARIDRVISGNFGDWKTESGEVSSIQVDTKIYCKLTCNARIFPSHLHKPFTSDYPRFKINIADNIFHSAL